jgi:AraC family transcriptional regulator
MDLLPRVMAATQLPFGTAEIVEWRWPSPMDVTACEDDHMIEMSLPPLATDGSACFPDISPRRFSVIGSMFLRPAGVTIRARSIGGQIHVVRLAVKPDIFAGIAGAEIGRDEDVLRAALNLRAEAARLLLHRIRNELSAPGFASAALLEAYGIALIVETVRSLRSEVTQKRDVGRLTAWQYRRVRERIEEDAVAPSVTELAGLCGLSVRHFVRLYRALTGENVSAQISRAQIARASALIEEGAMPLKEIAARLGFAHATSFSAAFRRATGLSPNRYRQQHRRN